MGNKVNAIHFEFIKKLDFQIRDINIQALKINDSKIDIFGIVIAFLSVKDKEGRSCNFEKTFLLADISMDITLGLHFLTLSDIQIDFVCNISIKEYIPLLKHF